MRLKINQIQKTNRVFDALYYQNGIRFQAFLDAYRLQFQNFI